MTDILSLTKLLSYRETHFVAQATNLKTDKSGLQLAHGVRNTAAGLRDVFYACTQRRNERIKKNLQRLEQS